MTSYYVIPADASPAGYMARAAALGCEVCVGDPTQGLVTEFPSVIVTCPVLATVVIPDNTGQATLAQVQAAQNAATTAEAADASAIATAQTAIAAMPAQMGAYQTQIQTDLASVANWSTLTASEQAAILGRILQGFATMIDVLYSQAIVTHTIQP